MSIAFRTALVLALAWAPVTSAVCMTACELADVQVAASAATVPHGHDCGGRPDTPAPAHDDGACACATASVARVAAVPSLDAAVVPPVVVIAPALQPPVAGGVVQAHARAADPPCRGDRTLHLRNLPLLI